jgi:hypothetical protein
MGYSGERFPVERRRAKAPEAVVDSAQRLPARRESDLARLKIQYWIELAEAALKAEKSKRSRANR